MLGGQSRINAHVLLSVTFVLFTLIMHFVIRLSSYSVVQSVYDRWGCTMFFVVICGSCHSIYVIVCNKDKARGIAMPKVSMVTCYLTQSYSYFE